MNAKPNRRGNLNLALERTCGRGCEAQRARTAMVNVIIGQLLLSGAIKDGGTFKLAYNSKSWITVTLEVGHDEIDDTLEPECDIADNKVRCMSQKINDN